LENPAHCLIYFSFPSEVHCINWRNLEDQTKSQNNFTFSSVQFISHHHQLSSCVPLIKLNSSCDILFGSSLFGQILHKVSLLLSLGAPSDADESDSHAVTPHSDCSLFVTISSPPALLSTSYHSSCSISTRPFHKGESPAAEIFSSSEINVPSSETQRELPTDHNHAFRVIE
jgi:hypothetical protein